MNPAQLEVALERTLQNILANRTSSGTAPANLANADGSGGLIVQAIFFDREENSNTNESVAWTGELQAFFVDEFGFFREDSDTRGTKTQLDTPADDRVFVFDYDAVNEELNIRRFEFQDNDLPYDVDTNPLVELDTRPANQLQVVWAAHDSLSSLSNDTIELQRPYDNIVNDTAASRSIYTWFDKNRNNRVDPGEQVDFVRDLVTETDDANRDFTRYLNVRNPNRARRIIDFVRGKEGLSATRNRTITESDGLAM